MFPRLFQLQHLEYAGAAIVLPFFAFFTTETKAQSALEPELCQAAQNRSVVELVYDSDESKGCEPRLLDVHQLARGKNGQLYLHGYQHRGCTKGRDYASERTYRLDKIQSVKFVDGEFSEKSLAVKEEGWDGCLGNNCFIEQILCE